MRAARQWLGRSEYLGDYEGGQTQGRGGMKVIRTSTVILLRINMAPSHLGGQRTVVVHFPTLFSGSGASGECARKS